MLVTLQQLAHHLLVVLLCYELHAYCVQKLLELTIGEGALFVLVLRLEDFLELRLHLRVDQAFLEIHLISE